MTAAEARELAGAPESPDVPRYLDATHKAIRAAATKGRMSIDGPLSVAGLGLPTPDIHEAAAILQILRGEGYTAATVQRPSRQFGTVIDFLISW